MRAKLDEKERAIKLRKDGWSVRKIAETLDVSRGSVSLWVRDVELTKKQKEQLMPNSRLRVKVYHEVAGRKKVLFCNPSFNVLLHYEETGYKLHAYVVMPDHLHLIITPFETLEKSVQLIKGGFSFRARRELEWAGEIWLPGFTDHRIRDEEDWHRHLEYIRKNPVDAKLVEDVIPYEFIGFPDKEYPQGLKPTTFSVSQRTG